MSSQGQKTTEGSLEFGGWVWVGVLVAVWAEVMLEYPVVIPHPLPYSPCPPQGVPLTGDPSSCVLRFCCFGPSLLPYPLFLSVL